MSVGIQNKGPVADRWTRIRWTLHRPAFGACKGNKFIHPLATFHADAEVPKRPQWGFGFAGFKKNDGKWALQVRKPEDTGTRVSTFMYDFHAPEAGVEIYCLVSIGAGKSNVGEAKIYTFTRLRVIGVWLIRHERYFRPSLNT